MYEEDNDTESSDEQDSDEDNCSFVNELGEISTDFKNTKKPKDFHSIEFFMDREQKELDKKARKEQKIKLKKSEIQIYLQKQLKELGVGENSDRLIKVLSHKMNQAIDKFTEIENLHITYLMLDASEYNLLP